MKKNILFLCLLVVGIQPVFAQSARALKVTYMLTYQYDTTDADRVKKETMILYTSPVASKFASANFLYQEDSLKLIMEQQLRRTGTLDLSGIYSPKTEFRQLVFKTPAAITVIEVFGGKRYQYQEPGNSIKWEITSQQQTIQGFTCQMARGTFAGREYVAWFTPEIPVSDGPYNFSGLPGLILEVQDRQGHYQFDLVSISDAGAYDFATIPEGNYIPSSAEDVALMKQNKRENPAQYLSAIAEVDMTPEEMRAYKERTRSYNNPIELRNKR